MPPVLPRKRLRSDSPPAEPPPKRPSRSAPQRGKQSVFQTLDTPPTISRSLSQTQALLGHDDDSSELSDAESSDEEFEDVVTNGLGRASDPKSMGKQKIEEAESSADEEWEDALNGHKSKHEDEPAPVISGDIELTLSSHPTQSAFASKSDGKKGPSKIQRQIRNVTHCMHVQFLMFHNLTRNSWIQDQQVQKILVENLTTGCWRELDIYWKNVGITNGPEKVVKGGWSKKTAKEVQSAAKWKESDKPGIKEYVGEKRKSDAKGSSSKSKAKGTRNSDRNQRDWGNTSDRLEPETPNLSSGDPLMRLLRYLSAYWRAKFKITVPSLRKRGYLSPFTLEAEINTWKEDPSDADTFGERIENLEAFRGIARKCEGSKDVGQQLYTSLLRGLGIEARLVASLQPVGFGWSQAEEGKPKTLEKVKNKLEAKKQNPQPATPSKAAKNHTVMNGTQGSPIALDDDSSSDLSSIISLSSDSEAIIKKPKKSPKSRKYADELPFPTYWTEVISHLTHTPICVAMPNILKPASTPDGLTPFYCRGAAADKARQVFAYIVAFSSDGTAKDVTTRYLPKHQWPGRTKGFRMPIEKIPIYNKRGKVKKWEEFDWLKSVMRPYARSITKRQPWDEIEDEGDLVPCQPEKPPTMDEEGGKETLQGYKNSAEYVLERHLRREEALKPGAKIVRHFVTGKGDSEKKEPVYRRKDIVTCRTVESWHKEGREVKEGEQPLKFVPMRAVTVTRKREIEEREREEGEKIKQGLYSKAQTDWIIPPPIEDGKIPRNAFGNIDVYVPTMIPAGAVHIPLRGTARVCKKLGVDFAEACTGFEFGKQRAVPVLTGVVVAAENEDMVIDAWEADEAEKAKKEAAKRETVVLGLWKKFFVGLRIVDRIRKEYGDEAELPAADLKPTESVSKKEKKSEWETFKSHGDDFEGGFVREDAAGGFVREAERGDEEMAGGFFPASQESNAHRQVELTIDHGEDDGPMDTPTVDNAYRTPISLHSALQKAVGEDEEEADEDDDSDVSIAPIPKPRIAQRTRGKSASVRGRSGQGASVVRKKPIQPDSGEEEASSSISSAPTSSHPSNPEIVPDDEDDEEFGSKENKKRRTVVKSSVTRSAPRRTAARQSEDKVKSHFFAHGSDEETDLSPVKSGRGRTSGRVRGRGRGRGRRK